MTLANDVAKVRITTNGGTGPYALTGGDGALVAASPSHLVVTHVPTGGVPRVLSYGADYSISGDITVGSASLTAAAALAAGILTVRRKSPKVQAAHWQNGDGNPSPRFESTADYSRMIDQELGEQASRTITAPDSDPPQDMTLQAVSVRAGFVAVFDSLGRIVASTVSAAALATIASASDTVLLLQQLVASLSGDYLFAQPSDKVLNAPTGSEPNGYRALVGKAPTGAFANKRGLVAVKTAAGWIFSPTPRQGQTIRDVDSGLTWVYRNSWWNRLRSNVPGAVYQHFSDVPDGTTAMGMVLATGQVLDVQGPGNTSVITGGRYVPNDNSYLVALFPQRELRMSITGMYRTGYLIGSLTLAAGTKVGGLIIAKMNHAEFLPQSQGDLSIWGGARQTIVMGSPIGSLATADLQNHYRPSLDNSYPLHADGVLITNEMTIQGNVCRCYGDGRHFLDSYRDDMISGSNGDDASGNQGYVYFQTGGTLSPNLPYVYEILAEPLAPAEQLADPVLVPNTALQPQPFSKACPFGTATEVCRFTPTDGQTYTFQVDAEVHPDPGILGPYAMAQRSYVVMVKKYSGTILVDASPTQLYTEKTLSTNAGTVTLSVPLSFTISGNDVLVKATTARSGSNASVYDPVVACRITNMQGGAVFR